MEPQKMDIIKIIQRERKRERERERGTEIEGLKKKDREGNNGR
jgi:hypothetical protein